MSQSVERATRIIDSIAVEPQTIVSLAAEFDLHRSTMFRELQTLEDAGYVRRRTDGRYTLGLHFVALAQQALETIDLREAAADLARDLHKTVGNTVHVAALMENSIFYVDKVEDASGVRMYSRVGARVHPHCSAVGKAILAHLSDVERDRVLNNDNDFLERYTSSTITLRSELDSELDRIRNQGWAVDDGEFEDFVNCIAVPILSPAGVVGALSITAIRMVEDLAKLKTYVPLMERAGRAVSQRLGDTT